MGVRGGSLGELTLEPCKPDVIGLFRVQGGFKGVCHPRLPNTPNDCLRLPKLP